MRMIIKYLAITSVIAFLTIGMYIGVTIQQVQLASTNETVVASIAEGLVERKLLPSISYAVIEAGVIVDTRTFGVADIEIEAPVSQLTLYEAASLTKPLIAEIARGLHGDGLFDLDEKVAASLSNSRVRDELRWNLVTPRHLLSHTSGLPNWSGDHRDFNRVDPLDFEFEPGSAFRYSGEGYGILLEFLEKKSGQSAEALANQVFTKLDMKNSTIVAQGFTGQYARGHWGDSPDREAWRTSKPVAAYSMFTNAGDYGLFLQSVIEKHAAGLVNNDPFISIQTGFKTTSLGEKIGWSLGWGTLQRSNDTVYFQWGDNGAFRSFAAFEPKCRNGVVYFTNGSYGTVYADDLSKPVLGDIRGASSWFSGETTEIVRRWIKL